MQVREIMSDHVICCTPDTNLKDVAKFMAEHDCGDIPVIQDGDGRKPIGVITDRDITCRAVAKDRNPLELTAQDCMSKLVVTVTPDTILEDCCHTMERNQIRRVPVVDERGAPDRCSEKFRDRPRLWRLPDGEVRRVRDPSAVTRLRQGVPRGDRISARTRDGADVRQLRVRHP
ncbi:MAG: CBS domain-containing protein [Spirochaetes bacterium]|nr:CBS domain-containing protein [Spirochaetota bacterium]